MRETSYKNERKDTLMAAILLEDKLYNIKLFGQVCVTFVQF